MAITPVSTALIPYRPHSRPHWHDQLEGVLHQLDHPATLVKADEWVPPIAYTLLVGGEMAFDQVKAKPEERRKTFIHDALTLGIPALATWKATQLFMTPEREVLATSQAALRYLGEHYPQLIAHAETLGQKAKIRDPKPLLERLAHDPKTIRAAEVAHLASARTHLNPGNITSGRLDQLVQTAKATVLEHAAGIVHPDVIAQGYEATVRWVKQNNKEVPNLEWPLRLAEERLERPGLHNDHPDGLGMIQKLAEQFLLKNELRLLLPFNEDFESSPNVITHSLPDALKHTLTNTAKDLKEEALPFLYTGVASILSGTVGGLLANKVEGAPAAKNRDVVNESVFQIVSNITMCALGATVGMGAANLAGFTKFTHPVKRLGTIAAGLAVGITVGANSANALTQRWLSPVIDRVFGLTNAAPSPYRPITKNDIALHLDDLPFALAASGASIVKTLTPPLFFEAARQTSHGFSSVASAHTHSSKKHHPPQSEIHSMMQPTAQSPALVGYGTPPTFAVPSSSAGAAAMANPMAQPASTTLKEPASNASTLLGQMALPKPAAAGLLNASTSQRPSSNGSIPAMAQAVAPDGVPNALDYAHHSRQFDPYAAGMTPAAAASGNLDTAMQAVTIQPGSLNVKA